MSLSLNSELIHSNITFSIATCFAYLLFVPLGSFLIEAQLVWKYDRSI